MEGEWAHGVAQWRSQTRTLKEPIRILAHRLPDGTWQALMPSSEGLYLQWVDAVPESLVPIGEKSRLRTQAVEADALRRPQAMPAVPPAVTLTLPDRGEPTSVVLFSDQGLLYTLGIEGGIPHIVGRDMVVPSFLLATPTRDIYVPDGWPDDIVLSEDYKFYHGLLSPFQ